MILYIHSDNKEKYLKIEKEFKKFVKKGSVYPVPDDSTFIIALGLNQEIKGGAILIPTNSESVVLSFFEVSNHLSTDNKEKTSLEICAALQEYCLFNTISQVSASVNIEFEERLKKHNWYYQTLINRQSIEENAIISLRVSHEQFIEFLFDGDLTPSFACNSPGNKKQKNLIA